MKLADVLLPLLGGGVAAAYPGAGRGLVAAAALSRDMQRRRERAAAEEEERARGQQLGASLQALLAGQEDPSSRALSAIVEADPRAAASAVYRHLAAARKPTGMTMADALAQRAGLQASDRLTLPLEGGGSISFGGEPEPEPPGPDYSGLVADLGGLLQGREDPASQALLARLQVDPKGAAAAISGFLAQEQAEGRRGTREKEKEAAKEAERQRKGRIQLLKPKVQQLKEDWERAKVVTQQKFDLITEDDPKWTEKHAEHRKALLKQRAKWDKYLAAHRELEQLIGGASRAESGSMKQNRSDREREVQWDPNLGKYVPR